MKIRTLLACLLCVAFLAGCASIDKTSDPSLKRFDEKKEVDMTVRP
jgi:predicted component of type VI protein secretion system